MDQKHQNYVIVLGNMSIQQKSVDFGLESQEASIKHLAYPF